MFDSLIHSTFWKYGGALDSSQIKLLSSLSLRDFCLSAFQLHNHNLFVETCPTSEMAAGSCPCLWLQVIPHHYSFSSFQYDIFVDYFKFIRSLLLPVNYQLQQVTLLVKLVPHSCKPQSQHSGTISAVALLKSFVVFLYLSFSIQLSTRCSHLVQLVRRLFSFSFLSFLIAFIFFFTFVGQAKLQDVILTGGPEKEREKYLVYQSQ